MGVANESVVVEGVAIDARLAQPAQVRAECVAVGESSRADDGAEAGVGWEFAAQRADA